MPPEVLIARRKHVTRAEGSTKEDRHTKLMLDLTRKGSSGEGEMIVRTVET